MARELGMTLGQLDETIDVAELELWAGLLTVESEERAEVCKKVGPIGLLYGGR